MNFMFNLEDYTTVAERIKMFRQMNPMGRVLTYLVNDNSTYIVFKAELYRDDEDARPFSTGYAKEVISERGVNKDFALENCETSSIGIACKNADIGTEKNSISREEAAKVKAMESKSLPKPFAEKLADKVIMPLEDDAWTVKAIDPAPSAAEAVALVQEVLGAVKIDKDIPECKHGQRVWRTGNKNGKAWANMGCPLTPQRQETWADIDKCDPIWYVIDNNGAWKPQEARS
jgi:hypothetical protein